VKIPQQNAFEQSRILYGAAYYAEYQLTDRLEDDLDLMKAARFTVIRVGESVWSTWEPRDGEFELDWLQPVLDAAHSRGIGVILGTPTYAAPPWLQISHPEIAAEQATGVRMPWGARQEINYAHPTFLFYAERIIRQIVSRYADHPAIIGFQVDNEPGMELFHNEGVFAEFVERLKATYGDVATLNREWGLTYWSHRISEWSELWRPDGNTTPQYDLAWRRYQAALTTEFISWQADLVREYSREGQFVTTCIAYPRPAQDDVTLTENLDVTAGNPYYGMQDHLAIDMDLDPIQPWTTTGVWGLFRQADRIFSSTQSRFLVTETNALSIAGSDHNYPPYPGQLKQAALAFISRGAAMVEYWHWHSLHFGNETYWGGILPHSQRPGRIYREVSEIGAALEAVGTALDGYVPDSDVTLLYSQESKWALEFQPPLHHADNSANRQSYQDIFDAFYRGVIDAGGQARIIHASQLKGMDVATIVRKHPVLIAPGFYIASDDELALLRDYAAAGGHLVLGIRTGYADSEARARPEVAPAILSQSAGVWYEEFTNLQTPVPVQGTAAFAASTEAAATGWADGLVLDGAEVLATYAHPQHGRFPAITTAATVSGRITYVGTVPNVALAAEIARWLMPGPVAGPWLATASSRSITVASGTTGEGARVVFLHNWSGDTTTVTVPITVTDLFTGNEHPAGRSLSLEPWAALALTHE
jgi:beta-galactosidase